LGLLSRTRRGEEALLKMLLMPTFFKICCRDMSFFPRWLAQGGPHHIVRPWSPWGGLATLVRRSEVLSLAQQLSRKTRASAHQTDLACTSWHGAAAVASPRRLPEGSCRCGSATFSFFRSFQSGTPCCCRVWDSRVAV